ncbi:MAG: nucleotide exchange factor GrpE [Puniceicoccales bacterium]|jgi:molecular chaperone GrpE|nr:nucleotide exchange factor GrpE [Puniceicoccales bacterium]
MAKESLGKQSEKCAAEVSGGEGASGRNPGVCGCERSVAAIELESARERIGELEDALARARADHDNYRKRTERERSELAEFACVSIVEDLLPVLDHFELGLQAAAKGEGEDHVVSGFSMILGQLRQLLSSRSVESIGAVGEPFDPHSEEAVALVPNGEVERDHIIQVVRRGYRIGKRLLRPAAVVVSSGAAEDCDCEAAENGQKD